MILTFRYDRGKRGEGERVGEKETERGERGEGGVMTESQFAHSCLFLSFFFCFLLFFPGIIVGRGHT